MGYEEREGIYVHLRFIFFFFYGKEIKKKKDGLFLGGNTVILVKAIL